MEVEDTAGEVLPVLQTEKLKYIGMVSPLGMCHNNNFSKCTENKHKNYQENKIQRPKLFLFNCNQLGRPNDQIQRKEVLYSYYLILENRAGFG